MVWQAVGALTGVGSSIYSSSEAGKGADKAKEAGRVAAYYAMQETKETLRRKGISDKIAAGQGELDLAATGLRGTGSSKDYLAFLETERDKESAWIMRAGELRAQAAIAGANITSSQLQSQSTLYALQGVTNFATADAGTISSQPGDTE